VTIADFGYYGLVLPKTFKLLVLGFPIFRYWAYLIEVIQETPFVVISPFLL